MPAGVPLTADDVNVELRRRQQGYGRGRRMQIETDTVEFLSGVRAGETLGSPIAMLIANRDWKNWQEIMDPARRDTEAAPVGGEGAALRRRAVTRPRPGHADLTGVRIGSHLVHLGGVDAERPSEMPESDLNDAADRSQLRTLDPAAEARMIEL